MGLEVTNQQLLQLWASWFHVCKLPFLFLQPFSSAFFILCRSPLAFEFDVFLTSGSQIGASATVVEIILRDSWSKNLKVSAASWYLHVVIHACIYIYIYIVYTYFFSICQCIRRRAYISRLHISVHLFWFVCEDMFLLSYFPTWPEFCSLVSRLPFFVFELARPPVAQPWPLCGRRWR